MSIMDKAKQVGQLNEMRKQAQQLQKMLEAEVLEHTYAGGSVRVIIRGDQKIQAIKIDETWLQGQSHEKLEAALKDAVNQAVFEAQKMATKKIQSAGGLNLPGM